MPEAFILLVALCATPNPMKADCQVVHMRPVVAESLDSCIARAIFQLRYYNGTTALPYKYTTCMIAGSEVT